MHSHRHQRVSGPSLPLPVKINFPPAEYILLPLCFPQVFLLSCFSQVFDIQDRDFHVTQLVICYNGQMRLRNFRCKVLKGQRKLIRFSVISRFRGTNIRISQSPNQFPLTFLNLDCQQLEMPLIKLGFFSMQHLILYNQDVSLPGLSRKNLCHLSHEGLDGLKDLSVVA